MTYRSFAQVTAGVLLAGFVVVTASAQQAAPSSILKFDHAVRVPGMTLPAGTYLFERSASDTGQRTVRIYRTNPQRLIVTLMAVPTTRNAGGPDVVFADTPRGTTPMMRGWFPHGDNAGLTFIYSPSELQGANEVSTK